jgi:hypothetical protein
MQRLADRGLASFLFGHAVLQFERLLERAEIAQRVEQSLPAEITKTGMSLLAGIAGFSQVQARR